MQTYTDRDYRRILIEYISEIDKPVPNARKVLGLRTKMRWMAGLMPRLEGEASDAEVVSGANGSKSVEAGSQTDLRLSS